MNGRAWTADDGAELRRLVTAGMTDAQIGERMDRNPRFIQAKRKLAGLAPGTPPAMKAALARINMRRLLRRL